MAALPLETGVAGVIALVLAAAVYPVIHSLAGWKRSTYCKQARASNQEPKCQSISNDCLQALESPSDRARMPELFVPIAVHLVGDGAAAAGELYQRKHACCGR